MPDHPQWFQRIPEILPVLEASAVPFLDRLAIERLFGVQRRQAIRILSAMGGYQMGRTFLVERTAVIDILRRVASEGRFERAAAQRKRIWSTLARERSRLQARSIPIPSPAPRVRVSSLPEGVTVAAGELRVRIDSPAALLERLLGLAEAAAADFDWFERLCDRGPV